MRTTSKNIEQQRNKVQDENILRSLIASFRIENINISDDVAKEIYQKVILKLKRGV
jgi:hypothetical protein